MLSASSIHRPPGPNLVSSGTKRRAPSFWFQETIPLKVPREQKNRLPLASIAGPSVLPQVGSEAIISAAIAGGAAGTAASAGFGRSSPQLDRTRQATAVTANFRIEQTSEGIIFRRSCQNLR